MFNPSAQVFIPSTTSAPVNEGVLSTSSGIFMHKKPLKRNQKYKTEFCKQLFNEGFCPYGTQCKFAHNQCELVHLECP